eukprot:CAMPEP_0119006188 /NCGR_PEP_ID=MMETSP1176-20130426/2157_1 /TAXON_ID=265551 /ORGANISM="Synedropsis recta cf, Strain CCMP1620" /LENGTH=318 /DNA_ID=CAMNT_0006958077 /DNA_START=46 /DNA_END=1002 /DNA_ORIENTATION=-
MRISSLISIATLFANSNNNMTTKDTTTTTNQDPPVTTPDETTKPSFPSDYVRPDVWTFDGDQDGKMGAMNKPTAGPRFTKALPRGEHDTQLYSIGTPNGMKVTILLEELNDLKGIEYDAWKINMFDLDQFGSEFVNIVNPNSKIPAMLDISFDPPLRVFESGNILKYLAEKYDDAFLPKDPRSRVETFNWLFWNIGTAPLLGGGFGHFYSYAPIHDKYAIDRYTMETKRQLDVLDKQLKDNEYIAGNGEVTIADFAIWPWIYCIIHFYKADTFVELSSYKHLMRWYDQIAERPAVKRGIRVNGFGEDAVTERHSRSDF